MTRAAAVAVLAFSMSCGLAPDEASSTEDEGGAAVSEQPLEGQAAHLRTTSSQVAPVRFGRRFTIATTYDLSFALDARQLAAGAHQVAVDVFGPGEFPYAHLEQGFVADQRAWVSMPVAGSLIESAALSGRWTARAFIDGAATPSATATFFLK